MIIQCRSINKRQIIRGVNFIKNSKFWLYQKVGKNQITVENNNEYNIITLNTQILQLWHVKEKYYLMKLSKIYLTSIQLTIVMINGLL